MTMKDLELIAKGLVPALKDIQQRIDALRADQGDRLAMLERRIAELESTQAKRWAE